MTNTKTHSPAPWAYEYNPYTLQKGDAAGEELAAFEVFDAEQNKIFDSNEDMPPEIQESNARLAAAAPTLLAALQGVIDYAENEAYSLEKLKDSPEAEAEASRAWKAVAAAQAAVAQAQSAGITPAPGKPDFHALLGKRREIAVIWCIEDVQEVRPGLTDDQAWQVLQVVEHDHDANIGVNWDVLTCHADLLLGYAPDTDEAVEA